MNKIIKFKKQGKDKFKIYFEDTSNITLYEDVILNNNLLLKKELSSEEINTLLKQNNEVSVYNSSINYISIRMRSKKELINYLEKKGFSAYLIDKTIDKLLKLGYLNDNLFCKSYINDQINLSNNGPFKIKDSLIKLGVDANIIDNNLDEIDITIFEDKLEKLIQKQIKIKKGSNSLIKYKLLNYFYNLGYDKGMVLKKLENCTFEVDKNKLKKEYDKLYSKYVKKLEESKLKFYISSKLLSKGYSLDDINDIINKKNNRECKIKCVSK